MIAQNKISEEEGVTVLMPVYNAAEFVKEAIESVLSQSYPHFELLIIEDCSADNSLNIIQSFSDSRIRIVQNEKNTGRAASLNKGIQLAKHSFIAMMDADNICHPWRLEKQVAYMHANTDCAMVSTWVRIIDNEGNYLKTEGTDCKFLYYTLNFECCILHSTLLFRKKYLEETGAYQKNYSDDFDLFCRISHHYKIEGIDEPLLYYRRHDNNAVAENQEYEAAAVETVQRNFKFYAGETTNIPFDYSECYRNYFDPLLEGNDLNKINNCIAVFDKISLNILATENPNRNVDNIHYIWHFKKLYILTELSMRLPLFKMFRLLREHNQRWLSLKIMMRKTRKLFH